MKLHNTAAALTILTAAIISGCDDGRIYPSGNGLSQDGLNIEIRCKLGGADYWRSSQSYSLSAAAFGTAGDDYADVSLNISPEIASERIVLRGVSPAASTVEICILDRLRKKVAVFASFDIAGAAVTGDTLRFEAGEIDVTPLSALQKMLFTPTCSACHGGSAYAAGGLSLTSPSETERATVGVAARRALPEAPLRVTPGAPDSSLLYLALTSDISASWPYDHSVETVSNSVRDILRLWITTATQDNISK